MGLLKLGRKNNQSPWFKLFSSNIFTAANVFPDVHEKKQVMVSKPIYIVNTVGEPQ